jgi:cysteinyl-tRNA synthetase
MSMKYLGESFDIHAGGIDLVFPHHENEIAQSEGATGKPFVRFWVHGEHLNIDQQKMSKSLGNIFTLRELLAEGYSPLQIRYALLSVPHRTKLNFTLKSLDDAKSALERLETFLLRLAETAGGDEESSRGRELAETFLRDFEAALDDDLNTAGALGALFTLIREANIAMDANALSAADRQKIRGAVERADIVLDIAPKEDRSLDAEVERLIEARLQARKAKNFAESDRIRDELLAMGIILEDTAGGMRWRRK